MTTDSINGGAFQIARKLFESDLWENKPSTWKVIWIYILGNVNHKENAHFERGEGFFNFSKDLRKIGNDVSEDTVKKFCFYAKKNGMMSTERSTRGMRIKVLNYNKYQTMGNYIRTSLGTSRAREEHETSTPINKNEKNVKNTSVAIAPQEYTIKEEENTESRPKSVPKYPHSKEVFSWFPKPEKSWKLNTTELKHAELLFERGEENVKGALAFVRKHREEDFLPKVTKPSDLERKWNDLAAYKP